jgi:hypothetical protein
MVVKIKFRQPCVEIFPAALLSQRGAWQGIVHSLPASACLLVVNPRAKQQTKFMQILARFFRQKGRQVVVWSAK